MSSYKKGTSATSVSPAPWINGTHKHSYNKYREVGNTASYPRKTKFSGKTNDMNGKVFNVVLT